MARWDDVRRIALALPDTDEHVSRGRPAWRVHGRQFGWERPLRARDREELGDAAPDGPILGARVETLIAKEVLVSDAPGIYFTTSHFDGYTAVLVRLERIPLDELEELLVEAWLCRAPARLARDYVAAHLADGG